LNFYIKCPKIKKKERERKNSLFLFFSKRGFHPLCRPFPGIFGFSYKKKELPKHLAPPPFKKKKTKWFFFSLMKVTRRRDPLAGKLFWMM